MRPPASTSRSQRIGELPLCSTWTYLLRHAKSSWDEPELLDRERPLAKRGRKAVALLREHFQEAKVAPDLVLCSSAVRAMQTLEGVRQGLPPGTRVEIEAGLYAAGAASLLGRLRRLPEEVGSVMLVGHNPGIEDLAAELAGGGDPDARAALEASIRPAASRRWPSRERGGSSTGRARRWRRSRYRGSSGSAPA
jgi:phosphohistidine phosphatase